MVNIERKKARRIENFFCNIRRMKVKQRFYELIYKQRGYDLTLKSLPPGLAVMIMSYLGQKELLTKINRINRRYRTIANNPSLWRNISIFASKESTPYLFRDANFSSMIQRSVQLKVLSLRYCQHVCDETLEIIADNANPFYLRELYLDGCEKINDTALMKLTKPRLKPYDLPNLNSFIGNSTLHK